ncbi:hypothetical protein Vadar_023612 [Vaccinium darrowii]|uniref:Uncharacterized protein n=1 Tax=Vaccinium darrowii TaxID=229202 RepID=A0ACB7XBW7_9ERIC|nr:hypothetical protein Vadar_023612 [Vaccinium darrowii]
MIKIDIRGSKNAVQTAGSVKPSLMFGSADNGASVSGSRGEICNKCVDIQRKDKHVADEAGDLPHRLQDGKTLDGNLTWEDHVTDEIQQVDGVSGCQVECENNKLSQISMTVATDLPFEESCNKTLDGGAAENLPVAPQNVTSHSEGEKSLKNRGKSILVYTRKGTKGYRKENAMQNIPPKTSFGTEEPTEEQGAAESLPAAANDTCAQNTSNKEGNAVNGNEENDWDRLRRVRWEKNKNEEEGAALGRGKRQRKAVYYKEAYFW